MIELNERPRLSPPGDHKRVLLHSCCAPCSGEVMEAMLASGIEYTIFFYNPNIHPQKEYLLRKDENVRFAEKHSVPFVDADYDTENWFQRAKGMEWEPERGARCTMCFDMRFERTALYAHENGFRVMTSSLGISRWKNMVQINDCGHRAARRYEGLNYWDFNWRKGGGAARMRSASVRSSISKNIADAPIHCGTRTNIAAARAVHRLSSARNSTVKTTRKVRQRNSINCMWVAVLLAAQDSPGVRSRTLIRQLSIPDRYAPVPDGKQGP
jgi:epoxyqueuosine reductase